MEDQVPNDFLCFCGFHAGPLSEKQRIRMNRYNSSALWSTGAWIPFWRTLPNATVSGKPDGESVQEKPPRARPGASSRPEARLRAFTGKCPSAPEPRAHPGPGRRGPHSMQGHCVIRLQVVSALGTMDVTAGRGWQSGAPWPQWAS